jgi:hypothetical protein
MFFTLHSVTKRRVPYEEVLQCPAIKLIQNWLDISSWKRPKGARNKVNFWGHWKHVKKQI